MDDFRKPYEYTEEKRGYILLFIIMLITIDILQAPLYLVPVYGELKDITALRIGFMVLCILYLLFIPVTAISCYSLKKNMVIISKVYLIVRAVFMSSCIIILFLCNVNFKYKTEFSKQYDTVAELCLKGLIVPLAFVLTFSVGWYLYFLKSKRCKEIVSK